MRHLRLSIAQIMLLVLFIGLAIGALRSPSPLVASAIWTATATLLGWSVVASILRPEHRRAFWVGFAVFGWVHLVMSFELYRFRSSNPGAPLLPPLLTSDLIDFLRDHVSPLRKGISITGTFSPKGFPILEFDQIARLLTTLLVAWIGGGFGCLAASWPAPPASRDVA